MGNTQIQERQEQLFDGYRLLGQEGKLKLLEENGTGRTFAISQECFINKLEYDAKFKLLTQRESTTLNDSILQLVRLWSKEHSGICSHLYKIYALYEYPRVKLIDQIEARKRQGKYFEQEQLYSIMQSCLNCISPHLPFLLLSPHFIFILPQGLLKLLHPHLIDQNARVMFDQKYYYAPEKMQHFQEISSSACQLAKEAVFSLGMTVLHCVLLQSPKLCYQISMKRFNYRRLQILLSEAKSLYSSHFHELLAKMLTLNPLQRPTFDELQISLNAFFSNKVSLVSSLYRSTHQNDKVQSINPQQRLKSQNQLKNSYVKSSIETLNRIGVSRGRLVENERKKGQIQDQAFRQYKQRQLFKDGQTISKRASEKQNLYSDAELMNLIREGIEKIKVTNQKRRGRGSLQIVQNSSQPLNFSLEKTEHKQRSERPALQCVQPNQNCIFAVETYHDNTRFEGMLRNNLKQGYGKLTYPDGVYYEGNFEADTLHGRGALYYGTSRPAYVGQWKHNKFHGKGVLYNEFPMPMFSSFDWRDFSKLGQGWIKYEGEFLEDTKSGVGKIVLANGELMEGTFHKGLLNGPGTFTDIIGNKTSAIWKDNVIIH